MPRKVWTDEERRAKSEESKRIYAESKQLREDQAALARNGLSREPVSTEPEELDDPTQVADMQEHTWLGARGASNYIPAWYKPHRHNLDVTQNGVKLGFKIKDVPAYCRWAIRSNGELMDQRDFQDRYEIYLSELCPKGVDPRNQHIPRVERFVNQRPDPSGGPGRIEITFDPDQAPGPDDGTRYDPVKNALITLAEQAKEASTNQKREQLTRMFLNKEISQETFEREMRRAEPDLYDSVEEASTVA